MTLFSPFGVKHSKQALRQFLKSQNCTLPSLTYYFFICYNTKDKEDVFMAKKKAIPGLTFSWKRATGVTAAKRKIAKATGIPTTRTGRRNKIGKILKIK